MDPNKPIVCFSVLINPKIVRCHVNIARVKGSFVVCRYVFAVRASLMEANTLSGSSINKMIHVG
jgi:hypothetical protein